MHGYNACVLEQLRADPQSYYHEWFRFNTFPEPNWIGHGILWVLAKAVPMHLAEKSFVFLLVLGNGFAFLSARSALAPRVDFRSGQFAWPWRIAAALLSLIFLFGAIWQLGFVNYLLGMVAVMVGLTHTSRLKSERRLAVIGWGLFTYFCHPISFLFFMGTFCLRELLGRDLVTSLLKPKTGDWISFGKSFLLWFGIPLALLVTYIVTHSEVSTFRGASPWRLLGFAYHHNDLALFSAGEMPFAKFTMLISLIVIGWGAKLLWKHEKAITLAAVGAGVLVAAVVFSPDYFAGGALIHQRLIPIVFVWIFWCAAHIYTRQSKKDNLLTYRMGYLLVVFVGISIGGLTFHRSNALPPIVDVLEEYREFSATIPVGSSILPVSASATAVINGQELSLKPVLHHYAANLDCSRDIVLLDNYEAYVGYFPLHWKEGMSPFKALSSGLEEHPARINLESLKWMERNVDYILTMGDPQKAFEPETLGWLKGRFGESRTSSNGNFYLVKLKE